MLPTTGIWLIPCQPSEISILSAHSTWKKFIVSEDIQGGFVPDENNYVYDIAFGNMEHHVPMPIAVGDYASGVYHDSIIYYIGGFDGGADQNIVQIYDTYNDTWSNGTPTIGTPTSGYAEEWTGIKLFMLAVTQVNGGPVDEAYQELLIPANPANITWTALPPISRRSCIQTCSRYSV